MAGRSQAAQIEGSAALQVVERRLALLTDALKEPVVVTRAFLRINPTWDALRSDPSFPAQRQGRATRIFNLSL